MADYFGAAIWIGGDVCRRTARRLCKFIYEAGVSTDWDAAIFTPQHPQDQVEVCRQETEGPLLFLFDSQARYGEFDSLETFLVRHEIAFMRQSDGHFEYHPELIEYRPGIGRISFPTDSGGESLVALSIAQSAEQALKSLLSERTRSISRHSIGRVWRDLRRQLPPQVPRITPFRIV